MMAVKMLFMQVG